MKKIVITGASGFIGASLVDHFAGQDYIVAGLVRNPEAQPKKKHVTYYAYDITAEADEGPFKNADYLIHAAYVKDTGGSDTYTQNVEGAHRLLELSRKHGLKKNIFLSSLSAKHDASSTYGKQKLAIEQLFKTERDAVLRLGVVVGNGGLIKQMTQQLRSMHMLPLIDGGRQPMQYVAVGDVAVAIQAVVERDLHGMYSVASQQSCTYKNFYANLAKAQRITVVPVRIPFWFLLLAIRFARLCRVPIGITEDNLRGLRKISYVDTAKNMKTLGVTPTPLDRAFATIGD